MLKITLSVAAAVITMTAGCTSAPATRVESPAQVAKKGISEIFPSEAAPRVAAAHSQFVDVRTPEEYAAEHAERAVNIPLDQLSEQLDRLDKDEPVYLICATGNRSMKAAKILDEAGFGEAVSIAGGTAAWKDAGLPLKSGTRR